MAQWQDSRSSVPADRLEAQDMPTPFSTDSAQGQHPDRQGSWRQLQHSRAQAEDGHTGDDCRQPQAEHAMRSSDQGSAALQDVSPADPCTHDQPSADPIRMASDGSAALQQEVARHDTASPSATVTAQRDSPTGNQGRASDAKLSSRSSGRSSGDNETALEVLTAVQQQQQQQQQRHQPEFQSRASWHSSHATGVLTAIRNEGCPFQLEQPRWFLQANLPAEG